MDAGPQSGQGGAGGEPKGSRLDATTKEHGAPQPAAAGRQSRPEHSSDTVRSGYRARPAGQSGVGRQDDLASTIREPQGDGNYLATDRGDKPLRNG
ncbi:hypothetical protein [Frateuria terrea]|uniref:Uncharacterized protein n=1 Tax=Frateuria terrea TaxID=529704 RepID=A0A1H6WZB7_9GAMM|nr:hypothetical protein [Frateuria terrea]SEJ21226.1 hypothetical protein SAMN04487997_2733 [Frateuria terrea]SFP58158.1 hypothetical protein SAMN02927913_2710 [Frateuria terrea]